MKIGVFAALASPLAPRPIVEAFGRSAEEFGFSSLWLGEHALLFDRYESKYPYSPDGSFPVGGEIGVLEPLTTLSYLAALTETVRLGTGICLVPQRNPVYTAKETANVDWLSNGRLDLGVGVGWLAEEFRALDVPFEKRGARTRSYLEVIRRLWTDDVSEYHDEFYDLPPSRMYPKPVQDPHPPIHMGGETDAALRRVADLGQGWYSFNAGPDHLEERLTVLRPLLEERGRSLDEVEISVTPNLVEGTGQEMSPDVLRRYAEVGADQVILTVWPAEPDQVRASFENLAETYMDLASTL